MKHITYMDYSILYNVLNILSKSNKAGARLNIMSQTELSAAIWHSTEHVLVEYSTVSLRFGPYLIWKIVLNGSLVTLLHNMVTYHK